MFQDSGFSIKNGQLWSNVERGRKSYLGILPMFGRNSLFSIDIMNPGSGDAHFTVIADTRYNLIEPTIHYTFRMNENRIYYWEGVGRFKKRLSYEFEANKWYNIAVERTGSKFELRVNAEKILTTPMLPKNRDNNIPEMKNYSGYMLMTDGLTNKGSIVFDNLAVQGIRSPVEYKLISAFFSIGSSKHHFSIIYEKGFEQWAEDQLQASIKYMRYGYEKLYRVLPDFVNLGMVQSRGSYYYKGFENQNRTGVVFRHVQTGDKHASRHELNHNWSNLYQTHWSKEGTAEFLYLLDKELNNELATIQNAHMLTHRKIETDKSIVDRYVNDMLDTTEWLHLKYWKASVFWYLVYRLIGYQGWLALHHTMDQNRKRHSTREIQTMLERMTGRDFEKVFGGWAYAGESEYDPGGAFLDSDNDGLLDLDEQLFGTNPNAAD